MSDSSAGGGSPAGPARLLVPGAALLILTYLGFVSLGLPDGAFGVAWPSLRETFGLTDRAFGAALLSVGAGFLVSSLSVGTILPLLGAGRLLFWSTAISGLGLTGFAIAPNLPLFLAAGLAVGLGGGAIDAGLNAYAAGQYSARQMNWLHAAFGLGAALGPVVMTFAVTQSTWRFGYGAIAAVMLTLAGLFLVTRNAWPSRDSVAQGGVTVARIRDVVRIPLVWLQVATFFVYVGTEVTAGQWAFAVLSQSRGFSVEAAGAWVSAFWLSLFAGRVLLGLVADAVGADRLIRFGALGALAGALLFAADPLGLGPAGLVLCGLAVAPIFPMLIHRTPALFPPAVASQAIGFQVCAAMIGSVAVPSLAGFAAARYGLEATGIVLVVGAVVQVVLVESGLRRHPGR